MGPSEAQRLKGLERESRRLKKLLVQSMLDNPALKGLLTKMFDLPRPCKARVWSDEGGPHRCIRPLASELRLQSGQDEMCAYCSHITAL